MLNRVTIYLFRQYPLITMVFIASGLVVFFISHPVQGATINITASVAAPPPEGPAVITAPKNGARSHSIIITVSGTCPNGGAYITLTRNDVFAGVTPCSEGQFSLPVSLAAGANILVAHVYNITNNPGPVEGSTTVYYDLPEQISSFPTQPSSNGFNSITSPSSSSPCIPTPILLSHEAYSPIQKKKQGQWTITLQKGCPPYTLIITWGDGLIEKHEIQESMTLSFGHTYKHEGHFKLLFEVKDASQTSATLQLLAIIDAESTQETKEIDNNNDQTATNNFLLLTIIALTAGSIILVVALILIHHYVRSRKS